MLKLSERGGVIMWKMCLVTFDLNKETKTDCPLNRVKSLNKCTERGAHFSAEITFIIPNYIILIPFSVEVQTFLKTIGTFFPYLHGFMCIMLPDSICCCHICFGIISHCTVLAKYSYLLAFLKVYNHKPEYVFKHNCEVSCSLVFMMLFVNECSPTNL
ncbi:hypothetical protein XENORESO_012668 [Xenotaenia resolanae]|uniref:Uncharacterized protein n=1 Tax=Xenotaenia resolanae TaxID=208358 RepID=A0ABV0W479_9TELE